MGDRAKAVQQWLTHRADIPVGRLALQWFRRYLEASHNSGSVATLFLFLSVGPLMLAMTGLFHAAGGNANALARHLIEHHGLTGETASLVRETFGTAATNALGGSVAAIIGFILWGVGVGEIYQDVYARAWRIRVRTLSDKARFTIWFLVLSGLLALYFVVAGDLKKSGWAVVVPIWLVVSTAFWLWTPRYLLHRKIGLRSLLPGALLATIVVGGTTAASPFFLGPSLNSDSRHFGAFRVVLALIAWGYTLATITLVCAVFSPVWAEWRRSEKELRDATQALGRDARATLTSAD
jgi:membrane protein